MCHIPVALEFLTCVLLWCLVMFYTSTTMGYDLFSILIVVLSSLVEAFGYAYLGSELSEQAEKVGVACYDLPWYVNCSKELKGTFQLMIQRSQKVCQLTGIKMLPIELKTYGDILRLSYSYYLILKDLLDAF
ncbi:uncharacterized protein LOC6040742 [Culex quinquefasciatus]|uniref:uncharacterized protein LOC6040742 n=1 Tax=Culex quinquefasciatus TaxID=7176 RepID=UPI0018E39164|nr:uncharacterized protein LOC6040742 [Culex quinquefasciatus]